MYTYRSEEGKLNIIGDRIRELRKSRTPKMTQKELAERLTKEGLTISRISVVKIERGERCVTDIEVAALCRVLNVSADALLMTEKKEIFKSPFKIK